MTARSDTVGFVGLGRMGGAMAANLLKQGFPLVAYDIDPAKTAALVSAGATAADGPAAVARSAARVVCMVETTAQARDVIVGTGGSGDGGGGFIDGATAGDIVICMSTIDPLAVKEMQETLAERGIAIIDAPVSGGVPRAVSGDLSAIVGGGDDAVAACRPLLEAMAAQVYHMGPAGQGLAMKLVNNMLNQIHKVAIAEAMVLGAKAGLDPKKMVDVIMTSSGRSATFEAYAPRYLSGDFSPGSTMDITYKDQELETAFAKALGVPMFMAAVSQQVFQMGRAMGLAKKDSSSLVTLYEKMAGVRVGLREEDA